MACQRMHLLPVAVFLLIIATFIVTYSMAVALGHVEAGFPYISETGSISPESCVFAQFLNLAAAVLLCSVYLRYRQVQEVSRLCLGAGVAVPPSKNRTAAYLGVLSCLGLDVVANFQESNVVVVHLIGAFLCFVCGTAYFCMQTLFSRRLRSQLTSDLTFYARVGLSVLSVVFTVTTVGAASIAFSLFEGENKMRWRPQDGGYEWHLVSTVSEWLLVIAFCSFILSFVAEFRALTLEQPVIKVEGAFVKGDGDRRDAIGTEPGCV